MTQLTGNCLCGNISFVADGDIGIQANCHCKDCQQVTGATFATIVFMSEKDVRVTGKLHDFHHKVDSGNTLSKHFCPNCGSQMFTKNPKREGIIGLRAGSINEKDEIKPQFNVYCVSKAPCTILDDSLPAFDKMPG